MFDKKMKVKISQIADLIQAEITGNPDEVITHPDKIESAKEGSITFFSNPRYEKYLYTSQASAIIIDKNYHLTQPVPATILRVENVYLALSTLFEFFDKSVSQQPGISDLAYLEDDVELGEDSYVGPFTMIGKGARIGKNAQIGSQVYIGPGVFIGDHVRIFPGVKIYYNCQIGHHVVLHSNSVIGSDGFGFAPDSEGRYSKIPQIGIVSIGDHVEVGANTVIDRASMGKTIIHDGVKLDNLIQVAHNVVIEKNTVVAAQAGISGSASIGEHSQIGGQVGVAGHLEIGAHSKVGGQAGVIASLEPGKDYFGTPAMELKDFMRSYAVFRQLPELNKEIHRLKKQIDQLNKS